MLIHEIFEAIVSRSPNRCALQQEDIFLTYDQLNRRSNQLAQYLRERGIGREKLVGICLERSVELVVAVFGVLKAGGACLLLDPADPFERLSFKITDSNVCFLLTKNPTVESWVADSASTNSMNTEWLRPSSTLQTVAIDLAAQDIAEHSTQNPAYDVHHSDLSFVFYTSGSTGSPKAVAWEHGHRELLTNWEMETFRLTSEDRTLFKAPLGFTLAVAEIFYPLLNGAQLVIVPEGLESDAGYLANQIVKHSITYITLVPSMLRELIDQPSFSQCSSLRDIVSFGEAHSEALCHLLQERSTAVLTIMYGTTEAPSATFSQLGRTQDIQPNRLGSPLPGMEIHLLNRDQARVNEGEQGEICIGGNLARGYVNQPALTADKFIAHPFSSEPGARLYRTGDSGRLLPDGSIEFVGRVDHQIQLRGYRIEPAEIELALLSHPKIAQAIVIGMRNELDETQLVAYVKSVGDTEPLTSELRRYLKRKLPIPMIPGRIVRLAEMPLNSNGKVDRFALPDPGELRRESDAAFVPASSSTELELVRIWTAVLNIDRVGIHDDFFDIGGDSLAALRVISRVAAHFRRDLALKALFDAPTIAEMALVVSNSERDDDAQAQLQEMVRMIDGMTDDEADDLLRTLGD